MIDQGLVDRVQQSMSPPLVAGGYPGALPPNSTYGWFYRWVVRRPDAGLLFTKGLQRGTWEAHCIGPKAIDAQTLAYAVDAALNGFQGNLPDPDSTYVSSCIQTDWIGPSEYDPAVRNQRIILEYEIWFAQ